MIDVRVLDVRPHPDQATNNLGCWAVQLETTHDGLTRTFWRWHTVRGTSTKKPSSADILRVFWHSTFSDLHGFSFNAEDP